MTKLLNVYIDEAGDEGFNVANDFVGGRGSSWWFIVAALVVPAEADRQVAGAVNRIKARLWPGVAGHAKVLHWRDLKHKQKKLVLSELKPEQFIWLAAAMEKTELRPDRFDGRIVRKSRPDMKTPLYNYTVRLMFERLTRLAKTMDRRIDVTFENRATLSIPDVVGYLKMLETLSGPYGPPTVPPGLVHHVTAQAKGASKMLQLADCCAGALNNALEPNIYGAVEDSYFMSLAPKLDRPDGKLWGHGLKFFPAKTISDCLSRRPEYAWLKNL